MVAGGAAAGLALPRPEPDQPDVGPPARARRSRGGAGGGHRQASLAAHLAAQLRHPSARTERRHPRYPGSARARQARDDSALYPRRRQHDPRRYQPLGPARREPGEATAARLTVARPPGHSPGVADIFRTHGSAWCRANAGHVSLGQLKVMSAIETCRTAALGGHVERCKDCAHVEIAYNSCRNRHCPKCQGAAARQWLEAQRDDLLPVAYYHLVFTLPAPIGAIAFQNKTVVYDLLFRAAAETLIAIAANPKHLGARVGFTAVLHNLGLGSHSPPARAHDCARRRPVVGRFALDRLQAPLLPARQGAVSCPSGRCRACSGGCFSKASRRCIRPGGWPSSAISYPLLTGAPSPPRSLRCDGPNGSSTPSGHSPGPQRCLPISLATPIASRSQTAVSSPLTTTASPSAGRIIAPAARRPAAHGSRP